VRSELTWMEGERVRKGADEGRRLRWEDSGKGDRPGRSGRSPYKDQIMFYQPRFIFK